MNESFSPQEFGVQWRYKNYTVFFGNAKAQEDHLAQLFPQLEWRKIKQVHGDRVVLSSSEVIEADAHFSQESQVALQIKTADCLPIFMLDPIQQNILAVHAGWRGVVAPIVSVAIAKMIHLGGDPQSFRVVIGPHIRRKSFEVDQPVWVQIMDSIPANFHHEFSDYFEALPNEKYKVDLEGIVRTQMREARISNEQIETLEVDTLTDLQWHSHRRDKEKSGRNISFIYRS